MTQTQTSKPALGKSLIFISCKQNKFQFNNPAMAQHFSPSDDINQVFAYTFRLYTYFNDRQEK